MPLHTSSLSFSAYINLFTNQAYLFMFSLCLYTPFIHPLDRCNFFYHCVPLYTSLLSLCTSIQLLISLCAYIHSLLSLCASIHLLSIPLYLYIPLYYPFVLLYTFPSLLPLYNSSVFRFSLIHIFLIHMYYVLCIISQKEKLYQHVQLLS